jgi:hypothetical protein
MDFVSVWKAVSIVLTGAFGMLGLLKSFKDKDTDKITPWGWVSLIGIVLSTSFGTAAQLVESSDAAQRSLAISTKTEQGLLDLKRILSPFDVPTIAADFKIDCSGKRFRAFCKRLARSGGDGSDAPDSVWRFWPGGAPAVMPFQIAIFKDAKTESEFAEGEQDATPDVQFAVAATSDSGPARLVAHKSDKDEWMLRFQTTRQQHLGRRRRFSAY